MIRLELLLAAEGVVVDRESNNASVFNMIEEVHFLNYPLVIPKIIIYCGLLREPADPAQHHLTLEMSVEGESFLQDNLAFNFGGGNRNRLIINIAGLAIPKPGFLRYAIKNGPEVLGAREIMVTLRKKTKKTELNS